MSINDNSALAVLISRLVLEKVQPKSQAQFQLAEIAIQAQLEYMAAVVALDLPRQELAKAAYEKAVGALQKATHLWATLHEAPEVGGAGAAPFRDPPEETVDEAEEAAEAVERWLGELQQVGSLAHLTVWFEGNKKRFDKIRQQQLRDRLYDSIRARKQELACDL